MKSSLKVKLILSYLMVSLVLVVSLLYIVKNTINREFENYIKENMEKSSSQIADQVSRLYQNNGITQGYDAYRQIGEYAVDRGLVLSIQDEQGKLLWCMDCEEPERCVMMLAGMEHNMNRVYQGFSGQYTETHYPMEQNGEQLGTVVLGYYGPFYYDNLDLQFLTTLYRLFTIAAVCVLAVSILLGLFMASRISNPIKTVIKQTKQIEKGNYDSLIKEESNTLEMEQLIGSVNTLAMSLDRQKKLRCRLAQDYAHEFRTPLASLQSSLEAMIDGIWAPTKERLLSLEEELLRLTRMVGDLGYLVEVEENLNLDCTTFDLLDLIKVNLNNFESELHHKRLHVTLTGPHFELYGDRDKFGQVIVNLLSNGVKYSREDGQIDISVSQTRQYNIMEVSDNGIGISETDLPNIFEHLYRADQSRTSDTGGSGIGLSIVRAIVEAHGGMINAESEAGTGSRFIIRIPK